MKENIYIESTIVGSIVAYIGEKQRLIHKYLHLIYCNNIMFERTGMQLSKLERCHQLRILHVSHCYIYICFINLKPFLSSFYQTLLYIVYLIGKKLIWLSSLLDNFSFIKRMYHSVFKKTCILSTVEYLFLFFYEIKSFLLIHYYQILMQKYNIV